MPPVLARLVSAPLGAALASFLVCAVAVVAAPKPPPPLSAEEVQLRELLQPLRDGLSEGDDVKPLLDWLALQDAAGSTRNAERELRRALKRMHDEFINDVHRGAEWVRMLQVQRSKLYTSLAKDGGGLVRATRDYAEFPPLPREDEILPEQAELPDEFLAYGDADSSRALAAEGYSNAGLSEAGDPEITAADARAPDARQVLDKITSDLTALGHLLHACDSEDEREKKRHREALDALNILLKRRRS